jgi:hypothetical protein
VSDDGTPLTAPLNIASLNRLARVALSGSPSDVGTFLPAFDRRLDTGYHAREAGPATLDLGFAAPQTLRAVTLFAGEGASRWSLCGAENAADLDGRRGTFRELVPLRRSATVGGDEVKLPAATRLSHLRLTVVPDSAQAKAEIRELNLLAEQSLEAIGVRSTARTIRRGDPSSLEIEGYFSGGETRPVVGNGIEWTVAPVGAATIARNGRFLPRRVGPMSVAVRVGTLASPPLQLVVIEADD